MKKLGLFGTFLAISLLTGCGTHNKYVPPTTPYEKVKTAFSGVESSFRNVSSNNAKQLNKKLSRAAASSTLDSLFSIFSSEDNQGDVIDDLSYTQPPMIQFQCLKYAFDKIGSNYSFDTKYYDTVTGKVYIDSETGFEGEHKSQFEYDYSFTLGLAINIDANDLITADVSFSISLSKDTDTYQTDWYVFMELDYNMDKENPTYILTMLTNNDETGIPYYDRCVYEYDYVDVQENQIKEWRKFDLEAHIPLVKDNEHQTFASYINDGVSYEVGSFSWYKNSALYKAKDLNRNTDRRERVAHLFYELGLNATDIDKAPFFNKQGNKNNVIQTMYSEFSNIFGKDVIYSLVTRDEDEGGHERKPASLKVVDYRGEREMTEGDECYLGTDKVSFSNLINNQDSYHYESPFIPKILALDNKQELIGEASIEDLQLNVLLDSGTSILVKTTDSVVEIVNTYHQPLLLIQVNLVADGEILDYKILRINCNPYSDSVIGWPFETLKEMGLERLVPSISSKLFVASVEVTSQSADPLSCSIYLNGIEEQDRQSYIQKLLKMDYPVIEKNPTYAITDTARNKVFKIGFDGSYLKIQETKDFYCSYSNADKAIFSVLNQDILLPEGLVFNHPGEQSDFFDYFGVSSQVFDAFKAKLESNGWKENEDIDNQYKYYFDQEDVRYCINYENIGEYSIRIVYFTSDIPVQGFDGAELFIKGNPEFPFGTDTEGRLYIDHGLFANDLFYVIGYNRGEQAGKLGYSDILNPEDVCGEYLVQASDNNIRVVKDVDFRITIINNNGVNMLHFTIHGGGDSGEGGYVQDHTYSLVGEFNGWDASTGNDLTFDSQTGIYSYKTVLFTNGKGFVIIMDHNWEPTYYGFSHLAEDYSSYVMEGETDGIVPIVNFTATIQFKDGIITLVNPTIVK